MVEIPAFQGEGHQEFFFPANPGEQSRDGALLVHGFPGTPLEMRALGKILAEKGIDSYGLLLPGFGSDIIRLNDQTRESWIKAIQHFYSSLVFQYDRIILIGFSFGAGLLINFLVENSIPRTHIILIAPFWDAFAQFSSFVTFITKLFWPLITRFAPDIKPYAASDFTDEQTKEELYRVFDDIDLEDPEIQSFIRGISIPISVLDELRRVGNYALKEAHRLDHDLLIIQGDLDEIVPLNKTQVLHQRIPDSQLKIIEGGDHDLIFPGSPHLVQIEEEVYNFLTTHEVN